MSIICENNEKMAQWQLGFYKFIKNMDFIITTHGTQVNWPGIKYTNTVKFIITIHTGLKVRKLFHLKVNVCHKHYNSASLMIIFKVTQENEKNTQRQQGSQDKIALLTLHWLIQLHTYISKDQNTFNCYSTVRVTEKSANHVQHYSDNIASRFIHSSVVRHLLAGIVKLGV
jgi:hypothetical protein